MGGPQGSPTATTVTATATFASTSTNDVVPVYVKELIAGGVAGACSKTAVAPLERVKIILQTRMEGFQSLGACGSLRKLKNQEGIRGFYKGNGASVIRIIPYAALHFMAYEQYRSWILNNCSLFGTGPFIDLLAGSAAGGTAVLCTYPLDLARAKLAYQVSGTGARHDYLAGRPYSQPVYNGIRDVFRTVYKEGGMSLLYRGVGPTLIGILPYSGLKFYVYELLKTHIPEKHKGSVLLQLSCGALAGLFGQTFTYPLDVVRRQMQVHSQEHLDSCKPQMKSSAQIFINVVRSQGWRQLYAGLSLNYLKIVPSVAIGFTMYDTMKAWLGVPPRQRIPAPAG